MTQDFDEAVPQALRSLATRPLFVMRLDVKPILRVGQTPGPFRRVGIVPGGRFAGSRLSGIVLDGGSDWQTVRTDGSTTLDVRLVLETDDDALITMAYKGVRHGAAEVISKLENGELVDPGSYYFRIAATFETSAPQYAWLNGVVAVGTGHRTAEGPTYSVFELL